MSPSITSSSPTAAEVAQTERIRDSMRVEKILSTTEEATTDTITTMIAALPAQEALDSSSRNAQSSTTPAPLAGSSFAAKSSPVAGESSSEKAKDDDDDNNVASSEPEAEDVPDSLREFICVNDQYMRCRTGQYTKALSRKVISDHFGRNKTCTRDIVDWPLFCRKHYQRATYNKPCWQVRKIALIVRQFDIIEQQFPGTTYTIQFKKSEEARLNQYSRLVASGTPTADAAQAVAPGSGAHFESPIDVLRELDQWLGKAKSIDAAKEVMDIVLQILEEGATDTVPAVEFLPQVPGRTPKTPTKSRVAKGPKTPRTPKTPKTTKVPVTPSRVTGKGSIKKTSRKA